MSAAEEGVAVYVALSCSARNSAEVKQRGREGCGGAECVSEGKVSDASVAELLILLSCCEPMPLVGDDQAGEQDLHLLIVIGFLNVTHRFINSYFFRLFRAFLVI